MYLCYPIFIIISTDLGDAAAVCEWMSLYVERAREEAVEKGKGERGGRCSIVCFFAENERERESRKKNIKKNTTNQ